VNFVVVGTGYTGSRVLSRLPPEKSRGISRSPDSGDDRTATVDLDDSQLFFPVFAEPYTLLYTVAPRTDRNGDPRLATLLAALEPRPARIVYLSTSGVYGDCAGELVNESRPANPGTDRAKRRLAAENLLQQWSGANAVELIVLRVAAIYGPGRLGLDRIRRGAAIIDESAAGPANRIHIDDLVDCCLAAMSGLMTTGIYNVCDGDFRSSSWFSLTVAGLAGLECPPRISAGQARRTFSASRLSFISETRKLDNSRMLNEMPHPLRYADAEEGIRASLAAAGN
jgi:nucleoside-diphosphate-sugar epimerase